MWYVCGAGVRSSGSESSYGDPIRLFSGTKELEPDEEAIEYVDRNDEGRNWEAYCCIWRGADERMKEE